MNFETVNYRGFSIEIDHDQDASNPWAAGDCEPPIAVLGDRDWLQSFGLDLSVPELTRDQIKAHADDIKTETGARSLLSLIDDYAVYYLSNFSNATDAVNAALCGYADSLSKSDRLAFLAAAYRWQGIAALCTSRRGYCQGEYIEILSVATAEWSDLVGAPADSHGSQLESAADLYGWYAFGDVYGYSIETDDGGQVGSVWGFYGPDHDKSGLLENARADIDAYISQQRQAKAAQVKKWIRGRVPLVYRSIDTALNV